MDRYKTVTNPLQNHYISTRPTPVKSRMMVIVLLLRSPYLPTNQPHGTLHAWDWFLPQGNTLGRLSTAQDRPDRPCPLALTAARQLPEHLPALEPGAERAAVLDRKYERAGG